MVTLRERLIAEGKLKPHPEIASLLAKPGPRPEQKKRRAKAVDAQTRQPKARPAKAVERYYLDESGSFEGNGISLAAGLRVFGPDPNEASLAELLGRAVKAWGFPRRPLPAGGVHAAEMKKSDPGAYVAFLDTLLKGLAKCRAEDKLGLFVVRDEARVDFQDRNIAHAAVLARGLASDLVGSPPHLPVRILAAGRAYARDRITDTKKSLEDIVRSFLAEELAVLGVEHPPEVAVEVQHFSGQDWRAPRFAGLCIADVISNLLFAPRRQFPAQRQVAEALLLPGCPHVLRRDDGKRRGRDVFEEGGAAAFLAWLRGPLGMIQPEAEQRALLAKARKLALQPGELIPTLTQLSGALGRQLGGFRNLVAGQHLAEELLELSVHGFALEGSAEVGRFAYQALSGLLDVCNHRGDVAGAARVMVRESEIRQKAGLGALVDSFEFRNRAAEVAVNGFDFCAAIEALERLIAEIDQLGRAFPLGQGFATRGRVLSHRAQVHHYLGQDDQALTLYDQAAAYFVSPADRSRLAHNRIRSLLGVGELSRAWEGLRLLGVTRELTGFRPEDVFVVDLVALAGRVVVETGTRSKLAWLPKAILGRSLFSPRSLGSTTQSGYPGAASAASVARVAARLGNLERSLAATSHALQLAARDDDATMQAISLAAVLEGLENLAMLGAKNRKEAGYYFEMARQYAHELTLSARPAALRAHFAPVDETLARWGSAPRAFADLPALRRFAHLVPFGRVGGLRARCSRPGSTRSPHR